MWLSPAVCVQRVSLSLSHPLTFGYLSRCLSLGRGQWTHLDHCKSIRLYPLKSLDVTRTLGARTEYRPVALWVGSMEETTRRLSGWQNGWMPHHSNPTIQPSIRQKDCLNGVITIPEVTNVHEPRVELQKPRFSGDHKEVESGECLGTQFFRELRT